MIGYGIVKKLNNEVVGVFLSNEKRDIAAGVKRQKEKKKMDGPRMHINLTI